MIAIRSRSSLSTAPSRGLAMLRPLPDGRRRRHRRRPRGDHAVTSDARPRARPSPPDPGAGVAPRTCPRYNAAQSAAAPHRRADRRHRRLSSTRSAVTRRACRCERRDVVRASGADARRGAPGRDPRRRHRRPSQRGAVPTAQPRSRTGSCSDSPTALAYADHGVPSDAPVLRDLTPGRGWWNGDDRRSSSRSRRATTRHAASARRSNALLPLRAASPIDRGAVAATRLPDTRQHADDHRAGAVR